MSNANVVNCRLSLRHLAALKQINAAGQSTRAFIERMIESTDVWRASVNQHVTERHEPKADKACPLCNKLPGDRRCFNHKEKTQ